MNSIKAALLLFVFLVIGGPIQAEESDRRWSVRDWALRINPEELKYEARHFDALDQSTSNGSMLFSFYTGSNYYLEGKLDLARDAFTQAIRALPESGRSYLRRGITQIGLGNYQEAVRDLKYAVDHNEDQLQSYRYWYAMALGRNGQIDDALSQATTSMVGMRSSRKVRDDTYELRGDLYRFKKDWNKAAQDYKSILTDHPNPGVIIAKLGVVHYHSGYPDHAKGFFLDAIEYGAADYDSYFFLGLIALDGGDFRDAVSKFTAAMIQTPEPPAILFFNRSMAFDSLAEYERSDQDLTKSIERDPTNGFAYNNRCYVRISHLDQAATGLTDCLKAAELLPGNADVADSLALAYEKLGRNNDAKVEYARALSLNPNLPSAQEGLKRLGG